MIDGSIYVGSENPQYSGSGQSSNKPEKTETEKEKDKKEVKTPSRIVNGGMSVEAKLLIVILVLIFIALNVWGYYLYRKGIFGIRADINASSSPSPSISLEKSDSIYMIPLK